jgi:hypothetical protein
MTKIAKTSLRNGCALCGADVLVHVNVFVRVGCLCVRVCGCVGVWVWCVGVWVCGCGVWVCGCVGVWVCGCVGVWVCGVDVWVCGCVGVWVCGVDVWVWLR